MTTTQTKPGAIPSFGTLKMEDRKRSLALDGEDLAPSRKRVLKDENGQAMRMDTEKEKDIESFQKDAIYRQMKDYKRQKVQFEEQYNELKKRCQYHDDHLRAIDAWFAQLLDEVRLLASQAIPTPPPSSTSTGEEIYGSALLFENSETFSEHLKTRSANIRSVISELFGRLQSSSPELDDLRRQLNDTLANEKIHAVELRRAIEEQQSLEDRLQNACVRYMTAEKKLDRAKSAQVLKLERQAIMGGGGEASSPTVSKKASSPTKESGEMNGELENGIASAEAEAARKEALAVAERNKAQLQEVEAENERLTNELSAARTKLVSLSDDDYAETSLFKGLKSQYEDVIKRVNDLEATNIQLREEAQKLHAERTSYRSQVDEDNRNQTIETEAQLARAETDLARIRNGRDELIAELTIRKSAEDTRRVSADQAKELAEARDSRIASLESEVERLKLQLGQASPTETDLEGLDLDALKSKLRTVEQQYALLSKELPSMEAAWRKTQALASRKVEEVAGWEEQVARLSAEKAKADQKYFAAMKAKDMREGEFRALKTQNARSSEIVAQLKESDGKSKELLINLERQVAEAKEHLARLEAQNRTHEQKSKEEKLAAEGLRKQLDEVKAMVGLKDKDVLSAAKAKREAEEELEKCKTRLEDAKKQYDNMRKTKAALSDNDTNDGWRKLAICPVCNHNIRNAVVRLCGHTFCGNCINDLVKNRSRKCPSCGKAFGNNDFSSIVLA